MEYNAISQSDENDEMASDASVSDISEASPNKIHQAFEKITLDLDNLGGSRFMKVARIDDQPSPSLGSVMRSLGSASTHSYDLLDEDDYDTTATHGDLANGFVQANHIDNDSQSSSSSNHRTSLNSNFDSSASNYLQNATTVPPAEPLIRSPVSACPVPLCHPTPDLQSLQGAYVGNVERLEKSAETLSTSSNIGEELRKLKQEQTRLSVAASGRAVDPHPFGPGSPASEIFTSSQSNSIIGINTTARSSGYSPGDYVAPQKNAAMLASSSQTDAPASRVRSSSVALRLAGFPEPENEDQSTQPHEPLSAPPFLPPLELPQHDLVDNQQLQQPLAPDHPQPTYDENVSEERSPTPGSTDTYRQSKSLFKDFDGVHFAPPPRERVPGGRVSLTKPPLARESQSFNNPTPGENMVFYPAPVPMMLNLPPRRSKKSPEPHYEKRRSQLVNSFSAGARKSVVWSSQLDLGDTGKESKETRTAKRLSEIPPQLRASAYFDLPPVQMDIEIKQNSAVATLDSILDASALAPVSAFTDHPIAGQVGSEVYGKPKTKKKLQPLPGKQGKNGSRKSPADRDSVMLSRSELSTIEQEGDHETEGHATEGSNEVTRFRDSYEGDQDRVGSYLHNDMKQRDCGERNEDRLGGNENSSGSNDEDNEQEEEEEEEEEEEATYVGAPTTLLAELQIRKQEQKQRNRTAATAFPNGMHSTLLELDAVAQHQRETRNQKHVTLAWEDPVIAERNEPDDEDVPLAVLFPKNVQNDENRPLGLMEKLALEENEPLSRRQARIRGEPYVGKARKSPISMQRGSTVFLSTSDLNANGNNNNGEEDEEEEGETLAQRARRLKSEEVNERLSRDFTNELLSQFGAASIDEPHSSTEQSKDPQPQPADSTERPEEETLGQRRRRLQAEKAQAAEAEGAGAGAGAGITGTVQNNITATVAAKQRHSMASVLQAHPARSGGNNLYLNNGARFGNAMRHSHSHQIPLNGIPANTSTTMNMQQQQQQSYGGKSTKYASMGYGYGHANGAGMGNGMQYTTMTGMSDLGTGLSYGNGYGYPNAINAGSGARAGEAIIDPGQRDIIDRWRQSVRY
ncbi:hypothetical protein I7I53_09646 [Histoplasma capsulatum var. duboisii H88]|uniref:Uncharacterized protein n=1 Tax=Ajellomyces capsulatus (strain H88) TaxID=544711 RepID=A0A8A1L5U7_AJEC8|nr:hypothetical protein I7I53_09646 [Histoplasma capsulatum var. duboisii H88]